MVRRAAPGVQSAVGHENGAIQRSIKIDYINKINKLPYSLDGGPLVTGHWGSGLPVWSS
jgi:hypothetical protein